MLISDLSLGAVIDIVRGLVMTLFILSALLLMLVILLQEGKGGGLADPFRAAGSVRDASSLLPALRPK